MRDRIQFEGHDTRTGPRTNGPIKSSPLYGEHTLAQTAAISVPGAHLFPDDNKYLDINVPKWFEPVLVVYMVAFT